MANLSNINNKFLVTTEGEIGVGVVPSSLWSSSYTALQIGLGGSLYGHVSAASAVRVASNVVYEGIAPGYYDKYLTTNTAAKYQQDSGNHVWSTASNGSINTVITWVDVLTLSASGYATFSNRVTVNGLFSVNSTTRLGGAVTIEGDVFMDDYDITSINELSASTATFTGSITVGTGNSSIAGDLYFGVNADIFKNAGTLKISTVEGIEYQVRSGNGSSGDHVFKSYNTAILTLNGATNSATFAGELNVKNASTRFISLNYEDGINSIISHSGTSYGLESLNVRGDKIYFYTDYETGTPKGNITLTLQNNHNAKFEGNVGIGISPGANSLHIYKSNATALIQAANTSGIAQVQFFPRDASNVAHLQSIKGVDSNLTFSTGGNSGNSYVPTEKMRIEDNGVTTIGMTNATGAADVRIGFTGDATGNGTGRLKFVNSNSYKSWQISAGGTPTGALAFTQSGTFGADNFNEEAMRITSAGLVWIGTASSLGYNAHKIVRAAASGYALIVRNSDTTTTNNTTMQLNRADTVATTQGYFLIARQGDPGSGTNRLIVFANGNVQNTNNSYGALSDERKKENIVDATPKLDDLMKIKIRNFNLKGEETKQIGVVAQELEEVFPSMIDESKDPDSEDETLYKSVKYSVFVPMLIKAIQELKAEIEILKQK